MDAEKQELNNRSRGWLKHVWTKATTPDDWSSSGEPHPWWDRYSSEPVQSFARFDLSETSYAIAAMAQVTPAWREVYAQILDGLVERHTTHWAAIDWLTQFGHDPRRENYPQEWLDIWIPEHLAGRYDTPGWTANGIEPWGLQPDPIGADGNLFFRGWFNMLMGLYATVSDDRKWHQPFKVAGVEGATFEWTHDRVAGYLADQWASKPEGPHCENTKIWPFCLSAAGLGLKLYDAVSGAQNAWVFDQWIDYARKNYMSISDDKLEWMALYFDPLEECLHTGGPGAGLGTCFYMLPHDPALAEILYRSCAARMGWSDATQKLRVPPDPRFTVLGLVLAKEFGDVIAIERLRPVVEELAEPRSFGEGSSEFGFWFHLGEEWPRGQLSALAMVAEVGGPGAWSRIFNEPNIGRFEEPTIEGVAFPDLGISRAYNDPQTGVLHVAAYAAAPSKAGMATRFRVTKLTDPHAVAVRRDGDDYSRWDVVGADAIEIKTEIGIQTIDVVTRGGALEAARPARPATAAMGTGGAQHARPLITPASLSSVRRHMTKATVTCPCCVGL
jgi:hypothetical protein